MDIDEITYNKYRNLVNTIQGFQSVAVAFSGGTDSMLLLYAAKEALQGRVLALTAVSSFFPKKESGEAASFCEKEKIRQMTVPISPEDIPHFQENPKNRCYYCKHALFSKMLELCRAEGIAHVIEGTNTDDLSDFRPGMQALTELHIESPLRDVGLS